jgi:hypothetical protein
MLQGLDYQYCNCSASVVKLTDATIDVAYCCAGEDESTVVCVGPGAFTFKSCTFECCTLVTTQDADVKLAECAFVGSRLAIFATGIGTQLLATDVHIGCSRATTAAHDHAALCKGVIASDGAALTLQRGTIFTSVGSAVVTRERSSCVVSGCELRIPDQAGVINLRERLATIEARGSDSSITVTQCNFPAGATSIAMRGQTKRAKVWGCSFSDLTAYGILAEAGARATAGASKAPAAEDSSEQHAVGISDAAGVRALPDVTSSGVGASSDDTEHACIANRCQHACGAYGTGTMLRVVGCSVNNNAGDRFITVRDGAHVDLLECQLLRSEESCAGAWSGVSSLRTQVLLRWLRR